MKGLVRTLMVMLVGAVAGPHVSAQNCTTCSTGCAARGSALACAGCGGCADGGCRATWGNCQLYDKCWFERYTNLAQRSVNRAMAPQVLNGHVLDQTIWNHHFETGTARLTPGGIARLQYLSRRRPEPDRVVYLATATDLSYDPAAPERYCGAKQELDGLRAAAIQKFLVGSNCGRCSDYQILVHDPSDVSISSVGPANSVRLMYIRYRGGLLNQAGGVTNSGTQSGPNATGGISPSLGR